MDMGAEMNIKKCFCRDEDTCPPKGMIDLFKCSGSPMFASLPHFYLTDPKVLAGIESGLNPNEEEHGIAMLVEIVRFNSSYFTFFKIFLLNVLFPSFHFQSFKISNFY